MSEIDYITSKLNFSETRKNRRIGKKINHIYKKKKRDVAEKKETAKGNEAQNIL